MSKQVKPSPAAVPAPADAEPYEILGRVAAPAALPRIQTSPPFLYMFHPERWTAMDDCDDGAFVVVPQLAKLPLLGGVSRVESRRDPQTGRVQYVMDNSRYIKERRGYIVLEPSVGGVRYCVPVSVEGGTAHVTPWEHPTPGSALVGRTRGYVAWLQSLVSSGILPPPTPVVLDKLEQDQASILSGLVDRVDRNPSLRGQIKRTEAAIEAIRATRMMGAA